MRLESVPATPFQTVLRQANQQISYGLQMLDGDPDAMGLDNRGATSGARHADALVDAATAFPASPKALELATSAQPVLRQAITAINAMDDDGYPTQRAEAVDQLRHAMQLLGDASAAATSAS